MALSVVALVVGASGWALGWSSLLTVKQISVVGLAVDSPLHSDQVIQLSGIKIGEPMARISGSRVKRALAAIPRVGSVSLVRKWPHKILLLIKERAPIAVISIGNQFSLIDSESKMYATVAVMPPDLPVISVTGNFRIGLKTAMSVLVYLPDDIKRRVVRLDSSGTDGLELSLRGGAKVIWGSSEDLAVKSKVLLTLLGGAGAGHVNVFDVSAPYAPTTS